ncbi:branched-chain amino acid ABC transporter permease, partial [Rummeliibacillus sp. POC4]
LIGLVALCMYIFSYFMSTHLAVLFSTVIVATIGVVIDR